ncbi:hypothetical protein B2G71_16005 [Novosphingobium sp. PC22D]|uniref:DUF924 family protein n=1 Tax=Novosphingobium sp. PC22D TaxID=1962403 RepID=UPI000BF1953C|nr:DUF924 family protein [Novosphingobium sp. PC22D]PEQ11627.1 hypothetical protein B2G71_16005 [Novosphingobium sp. PC22D]
MAASRRPWAEALLRFWFRELAPAQWFSRDETVDAALRARFGRWLTALGTAPAESFLDGVRTARAAILLFDQVPRNLYRDDPRAYAFDPLAREIVRLVLARDWDRGLDRSARHFIYMPMMHSEQIADQCLCLRLFRDLDNAFLYRFAADHHAMIARFGRFPHRNEVLGRPSSPAEERAVAEGAAS